MDATGTKGVIILLKEIKFQMLGIEHHILNSHWQTIPPWCQFERLVKLVALAEMLHCQKTWLRHIIFHSSATTYY